MEHEYYVYILTNPGRTVLYTGVTNNIRQRIMEHYLDRGKDKPFAAKYSCHNLLYYELFDYINNAIKREKEIKKWSRAKKEELIRSMNPEMKFLNVELFGKWPPGGEWGHRRDA